MKTITKVLLGASASALLLGLTAVPAFASPPTYHATDQASLVSDLATASAGDTIVLDNGFNVTSEIAVNTSGVTIDGNGKTLTPTFTKSTNSNNSTLGIYGSDVTVKDLTVDGTGGTNLHGINAYEATNVLLDNVTLKDNGHNGLVVNGSTVTVNNITTADNGWGGIDVDLGSGVTTSAVLTVNGVSHQSDAHGMDIYIDDTTKNVSVVDTNSQYTYVDHVKTPTTNDRLYTQKDAPTDKNECKDGGWSSYRSDSSGHGFMNQGQCVSYVVSNEHAGKN